MPTKPIETRDSLQRKAAHARKLAKGVVGDQAEERLIEYAKQLESRAAGLNKESEKDDR